MDLFFMSVWDDAHRGTKFYVCFGEERVESRTEARNRPRVRRYQMDTLPLFFLPDSVAVSTEGTRIMGELWNDRNIYFLANDPPNGTQYYAHTRPVYRLLGDLKVAIRDHNNGPAVATLPAPGEWGSTMTSPGGQAFAVAYGAGGGGGSSVGGGSGGVSWDGGVSSDNGRVGMDIAPDGDVVFSMNGNELRMSQSEFADIMQRAGANGNH